MGMKSVLHSTWRRQIGVSEKSTENIVSSEVLTEASMPMAVFWVVTPRSLIEVNLKMLPDHTAQQPRRHRFHAAFRAGFT
jgi:hypothetical protein